MTTLPSSETDLAAAAALATPDAVVVVDREGVIRLWNQGAERIFGWPAGEALGRSLDLIVPERLRERHWEGFHRAVETGTTSYGPESLLSVPALRSDGEQISVDFTVALLGPSEDRSQSSGPAGLVAVIRDVTARRKADRELRTRLAELEAAAGHG